MPSERSRHFGRRGQLPIEEDEWEFSFDDSSSPEADEALDRALDTIMRHAEEQSQSPDSFPDVYECH